MHLKCSIIIPLYNKAPYIERALQAVYRQNHKPCEIIVIDDVSSDQSFDIAKEFLNRKQNEYPTIAVKYYQNDSNLGPGATRNRGIAEASGDILFFLDADDEYHPWLLERVCGLFSSESASLVVFGFREMPDNRIKPALNPVPSWLRMIDPDRYIMEKPLEFVFDRQFPIGPGSNVAVSLKALGDIRYDETAHVFEGVDFWFRVLQKLELASECACFLKGPYHTVHKLENSLIRKRLRTKDVQIPRLLKRYENSRNQHETQLYQRFGKVWFRHDYSRMNSWQEKLKFLWKFRHFIRLAFQRAGIREYRH